MRKESTDRWFKSGHDFDDFFQFLTVRSYINLSRFIITNIHGKIMTFTPFLALSPHIELSHLATLRTNPHAGTDDSSLFRSQLIDSASSLYLPKACPYVIGKVLICPRTDIICAICALGISWNRTELYRSSYWCNDTKANWMAMVAKRRAPRPLVHKYVCV